MNYHYKDDEHFGGRFVVKNMVFPLFCDLMEKYKNFLLKVG
jgi:hypothetical protein